MIILILNVLILVINESNMSEAIIWVVWVVSGVVITFLTQIFYYHWIEKYELQKEREFNFQKELYFHLQQKIEIIIGSLEQDYFDILHINPDTAPYLKRQDRIAIKEAERISLINTYFPEAKEDLEKYNIQHGNIIEMLPWELNWQEHTSDSFNNELLLYRVTSDELKNILYTWLMQKKPN